MKKDFFKYALLALTAVGMLSISSCKKEEEPEGIDLPSGSLFASYTAFSLP